MGAQAVQVRGTEVHRLFSQSVGDEFEIAIAPPLPGTAPASVVYQTDGNAFAALIVPITQMLTFGGEIPPVLTVAIGYPRTGDSLAEFARYAIARTRDFTPTVDEQQLNEFGANLGAIPEAGGAERFLTFLTDELRPWLGERFSLPGDSVYVGDSMGGLFGTWVLLHHTQAFNRYVIGSPWLYWDEANTSRWEAEYAAMHADLPASVYLAAGAEENVLGPYAAGWTSPAFAHADTAARTRQLGEALAGRGYANLRLTTRILPDETHFTLPGALGTQGLRTVFAPA